MNQLTIHTPRLRLIAANRELAKAAITNKVMFSNLLNATVSFNWPQQLLKDAEPFFAETMENDPESVGWWLWYVILKSNDSHTNDILIGNSGFKGRPSSSGIIEVGYSILEEFHNNGFATEATLELMKWAFDNHQVSCIIGQTLPHLKPSIRVLEKCGMTFMGEGYEEGEENVIRYGITKSEWVDWIKNKGRIECTKL